MPTFRPRPAFLSDVLNAAAFFGLGPVAPGELISLTGIGLGPGFGRTNPPGVTGNIFPHEPAPLQMPSHVRAYAEASPVEIPYAGAAPGLLSGIDQINVRIPMTISGTGDAVSVFLGTEIADAMVTSGEAIFVRRGSEVR